MTTHTDKANRYIQGVLNGDILACKWIKLASLVLVAGVFADIIGEG